MSLPSFGLSAALAAAPPPALDRAQTRWQASREPCRRAADPAACLKPIYRARVAALREEARSP